MAQKLPAETAPNKQHLHWLPWQLSQSVKDSNGTLALFFQKRKILNIFYVLMLICTSSSISLTRPNEPRMLMQHFPLISSPSISITPVQYLRSLKHSLSARSFKLTFLRHIFSQIYFSLVLGTLCLSTSPTLVIPTPSWARHAGSRQRIKNIFIHEKRDAALDTEHNYHLNDCSTETAHLRHTEKHKVRIWPGILAQKSKAEMSQAAPEDWLNTRTIQYIGASLPIAKRVGFFLGGSPALELVSSSFCGIEKKWRNKS